MAVWLLKEKLLEPNSIIFSIAFCVWLEWAERQIQNDVLEQRLNTEKKKQLRGE